jgi:hypothetical protein
MKTMEYGQKTARQKYAKNSDYQVFRETIWVRPVPLGAFTVAQIRPKLRHDLSLKSDAQI